MPQVINTNIASLNAQRNLNETQGDANTALERLSSGLRVNSAKDDAAGLAISERFTAQINGLDQAVRNANDGISLAQVTEGALDESANALQRIRELAIQSANATNSDTDREALNNEVQQRIAEIDRIASQTTFNGLNVLDGTLEEQVFQVGANTGDTIGLNLNTSTRAEDIGKIALADSGDISADDFSVFVDGDGDAGDTVFSVTVGGGEQIDASLELDGDLFDGGSAVSADRVFTEVSRQINDQLGTEAYASFSPNASNDDADFELRSTDDLTIEDAAFGGANTNPLDAGQFSDGTEDVAADADGSLDEAAVDTVEGANDTIIRADKALNQINSLRAELGAVQNRFESTIANLQAGSENLTASRSRIQDADFAKESAELSRTQTLQQAGLSVLSQANQRPQQVLQLIQG